MSYVHYSALAYRLILAELNSDEHAADTIAAEIGDCPHCWRIIAEDLAETAAVNAVLLDGPDEAIASTEKSIIHALDWLARRAES